MRSMKAIFTVIFLMTGFVFSAQVTAQEHPAMELVKNTTVERLVEFQFSHEGILLSDTEPIQ